jgi:hypothetical protein
VIYLDIPLGHDLPEITQAQRKSKILTDAQDDDLGFKMSPLEQRWPVPSQERPSLSDSCRRFGTLPSCFRIHHRDLLHARVIITTNNQHLQLLSPEPSFVGCYKSKIVVVMESAFTWDSGRIVPYPETACERRAVREKQRCMSLQAISQNAAFSYDPARQRPFILRPVAVAGHSKS